MAKRNPHGLDAGLERQIGPVEQPANGNRWRPEEKRERRHQNQGGGGPQRGEEGHDVRKARPEMTPNGPPASRDGTQDGTRGDEMPTTRARAARRIPGSSTGDDGPGA